MGSTTQGHGTEVEKALACAEEGWDGDIDVRRIAQPLLDLAHRRNEDDPALVARLQIGAVELVDALAYALTTGDAGSILELRVAAEEMLYYKDLELNHKVRLPSPESPSRASALRSLRRGMLDEMEAMEKEGKNNSSMALSIAEHLTTHVRGTGTDHLPLKERAFVIEEAFDEAEKDTHDDSDAYDKLRVKLSFALRALRAVPKKTGKRREARRKACKTIRGLLDKQSQSLDSESGRQSVAQEVASVLLQTKHLAYLRMTDPNKVHGVLVVALAKFGHDRIDQLAFELVDEVWTRDANVDPVEEPPPPTLK